MGRVTDSLLTLLSRSESCARNLKQTFASLLLLFVWVPPSRHVGGACVYLSRQIFFFPFFFSYPPFPCIYYCWMLWAGRVEEEEEGEKRILQQSKAKATLLGWFGGLLPRRARRDRSVVLARSQLRELSPKLCHTKRQTEISWFLFCYLRTIFGFRFCIHRLPTARSLFLTSKPIPQCVSYTGKLICFLSQKSHAKKRQEQTK